MTKYLNYDSILEVTTTGKKMDTNLDRRIGIFGTVFVFTLYTTALLMAPWEVPEYAHPIAREVSLWEIPEKDISVDVTTDEGVGQEIAESVNKAISNSLEVDNIYGAIYKGIPVVRAHIVQLEEGGYFVTLILYRVDNTTREREFTIKT